jgi:branched-chain amino acid transport system ATP-binding protein
VTGLPPEEVCRRGVARTFQRNNLFRDLSVLENVRLAVQAVRGQPLNFWSPASSQRGVVEAAKHALSQVGLGAVMNQTVRNLSYGEQRQLEIAIALASEPRLLLLDEPTSGMAAGETARMIELVAGLPRTLAILMIEHDMKVVFSLADRLTVLYYGEVLASGAPEAISTDARVREVYLGTRH